MRVARLALTVSALTLLLGLAPYAAAAAGSTPPRAKICKNTYGGDVISAKNVSCKKARAVVREWAAGYKADGKTNRRARGFSCKGRNEPAEGLTIRCTRDEKRIRFYANVP